MPGFFRAIGIPLVGGRDFASTDLPSAPAVVIVDETLARQHWPGQSAIGKRVNASGGLATVVGVVGHVRKAGPQSEGEPQIYLPFAQNPQGALSIVARSRTQPLSLVRPIREAVRQLDPQLPISKVSALDDLVAGAMAKQRFNALLLGVFALTALVLASVGLYGVMAYLVTQRTREIGIRVALGGQPSAIRAMVMREGLWISFAGTRRRHGRVAAHVARAERLAVRRIANGSVDLRRHRRAAARGEPSRIVRPSPPRHARRSADCTARIDPWTGPGRTRS